MKKKPIPENSWFYNIKKGDPWCVGFRHFLKKKNVPGFLEKRNEFISESKTNLRNNRENFTMWSTLAELDTFIIVEKFFNGKISGFNVKKTDDSGSKNCDFSAHFLGGEYRCEVKSNCKELNYSFTENFRKAILEEFKSTNFNASLKIKNPNPDFSKLVPLIKSRVRRHIELFNNHLEKGLLSSFRKNKGFPQALFENEFEIYFFKKEVGKNSVLLEAFQAVEIQNVRMAIFSSGNAKSLIEQALDKGAEFLFVKVPGWFSKDEISSGIFSEKNMDCQFIINSKELNDLEIKGVCVFSRKDHYVMALNSQKFLRKN
jgi:hypothetical protein